MDVQCRKTSINIGEVKEDRISNLPDDIIHHILSFLDMKYAMQTSSLSTKWKNIWTTIPHLNFNSRIFPTLRQFAKFVKHVLSHRNHHTEVSTVELSFTGASTDIVVENIIRYAYSHNVTQLSISMIQFYSNLKKVFPQCVFSSHTLKHLTLATVPDECLILKSALDLPVLETLKLCNLVLGDYKDESVVDLFSKCVNLKDLTLYKCVMENLHIFNICAPKLSNLTIIDCNFVDLDAFNICAPKLSNLTIIDHYDNPVVLNVVAPELENLRAILSSLTMIDFLSSTKCLDSLEKVNLSLADYPLETEIDVPDLLDLFQLLRSAKFLIFDMNIIQILLSGLDQLLLKPCPFKNLKWLKIDTEVLNLKHSVSMTKVINYLLESSPNATFIMDLPQVPQKRSREEIEKETMVAKLEKEKQQLENNAKMLEAKIQIQDEIIADQKVTVEKFITGIISYKMGELQMQVVGGNPNYEVIRSIKSFILELTPENLTATMEAQFSRQYEEVKSRFLTNIHASQWEKIEMELAPILQLM